MNLNSRSNLNSGNRMPYFGLGVYLSQEGEECFTAVTHALQNGYRLIDTASFYENEYTVGQAIKSSGIEREEVFVTTKLWNADHGYDAALRAFELSYKKLGLPYIDLYLVHYPVEDIRNDSWRAMERLFEEGLCKSIGVSNYMAHHLNELLTICRVPPAVNQIELSPFCYRSRKETIKVCLDNDVQIQAYSPLTRARKMNDPVVQKLGKKYNKTWAQVLLRWAIDRGFSTIPKSADPMRIEQNASIFDFRLESEELKELEMQEENFVVCWDPMQTP